MRITICLDTTDARRWLLGLADQLTAAGHQPRFRLREGPAAPDRAIALVLAAQSRIFGAGRAAWEPIASALLPFETPEEAAEITLDLSHSPEVKDADLRLFLDGTPGVAGLCRALVGNHIPYVEIRRPDGTNRITGLPSVEEPAILTRALDQFTIRLGTLIVAALDRRKRATASKSIASKAPVDGSPLGFLMRGLVQKTANRLMGGRLNADHWRVGVRPLSGKFLPEGDIAFGDFTWLPDDGARYYADPILWSNDGRTYLFVEEYPYATAKGILAYTELGHSGEVLFTPRPIIERPGHLSYPYVFEHAGDIYMIPENSAEGHVPLYRARRFPDQWDYVRPLIEGIGLHDASLIEHAGYWWLLGNAALDGGSSWDCLMIYRADSPLGPFTPHRSNPVLIDARDTRPAGPAIRAEGALIRPVQSCLGGYGRFTRFVEIEELTLESFIQRQRGRILAPLDSPVRGTHTYSRNSGFEAIDALTPRGHTLG